MSSQTFSAPRDANRVPTIMGVSSSDNSTPVVPYVDPVTHRLLVNTGGGTTGTFVYNEIVAGSGTTFTLTNTPLSGAYAIFANGQRLTPGAGNDFTITGAVITTALSWSAGAILADYQY